MEKEFKIRRGVAGISSSNVGILANVNLGTNIGSTGDGMLPASCQEPAEQATYPSSSLSRKPTSLRSSLLLI
jgi:hypothetical protein